MTDTAMTKAAAAENAVPEAASKSKPLLHLRPHHLLCIQNYRGHGYSNAFHEKMTAVIEALGTPAGTAVELTA